MQKSAIILSVISLFLIISCSKNDTVIIEQFNSELKKIQKQTAPDLSLEVFDFSLRNENGQWHLTGDYTTAGSEKPVIGLADSLLGKENYIRKFIQLPDPVLGDSIYGIINVSTANLRRNPRNAAELVDQAILGSKVRLLKKKGMWYLIQTEYGYLGWMAQYSFQRMDSIGLNKWNRFEHLRVTSLNGFIYSQPSNQSIPVIDVTLNAVLVMKAKKSSWTEVVLPDGRTGYIENKIIEYKMPESEKLTASAIISTAKSMMGIPYLWGGNSTKGNDCSGFTQTVFRTHGRLLPRDARQQVFLGDEIDPDSVFSNIKSGDLLFFGVNERITHVGISLGGYEFIHQDSWVNIDSFDENAENFNEFRKKSLKKIKRIIF